MHERLRKCCETQRLSSQADAVYVYMCGVCVTQVSAITAAIDFKKLKVTPFVRVDSVILSMHQCVEATVSRSIHAF